MIVLRRFHERCGSILVFGKNRCRWLGFDGDVCEELRRIQYEFGALLKWLEYVVIAIVCGQRNRRSAAIFRHENLLHQFRGELSIAVPPGNVGVLAKNNQLALPALSHLIHTFADFVREPRHVVDDDHLVPGNLFRRHTLRLHEHYFIRQVRRRRERLA